MTVATRETSVPIPSRALVAATVAYAILVAVGLAAIGTLPAASETGAQVVSWLREHRSGVRLGVWAFTVAAPLFALMVALLCRMLPAPHRDVFRIGAITFMAATTVMTWAWAGLALHADQLEPAMARAILDVAASRSPGER